MGYIYYYSKYVYIHHLYYYLDLWTNMENEVNIVWLRRAELALATLILVYGELFRSRQLSHLAPDSELVDVIVFYGGLFFLPLGLAIISLLTAVFAESTLRSYLTGAVVTVILLGILGSWTLFFFAGGGVQVGHLLSFAFGLLLAVVVLVKQTTLRLRPHLAELRQ